MENPGYPDARNIFELQSPELVPLAVDATPDIVRGKLYIDGVYTAQKGTSAPFSINWERKVYTSSATTGVPDTFSGSPPPARN